MKIIDVTPGNIDEFGLFCIKNKKEQGYKRKLSWFIDRFDEGLKLKILQDNDYRTIGFIEYIPAEFAWRPVNADDYYFIHCIMVQKKDDRGKDYASMLLNECEKDVRRNRKAGICTFTSSGTWLASDKLFIKNGFRAVNSLERFELMAKKFNHKAPDPMFIDWLKNRKKLKGWHLIYSHQCPWHYKSVDVMIETASKYEIKLNVKKMKTSADVRKAPTGYGTFSLIKDRRVLEDHYLSKTRFETILKKELNSSE